MCYSLEGVHLNRGVMLDFGGIWALEAGGRCVCVGIVSEHRAVTLLPALSASLFSGRMDLGTC